MTCPVEAQLAGNFTTQWADIQNYTLRCQNKNLMKIPT